MKIRQMLNKITKNVMYEVREGGRKFQGFTRTLLKILEVMTNANNMSLLSLASSRLSVNLL
jgi:hypothetical protein